MPRKPSAIAPRPGRGARVAVKAATRRLRRGAGRSAASRARRATPNSRRMSGKGKSFRLRGD